MLLSLPLLGFKYSPQHTALNTLNFCPALKIRDAPRTTAQKPASYEILHRNIFWLENLKRRDHPEDIGVDGLAEDRGQCRDIVNTVMNLRIP